MKKFKLDENENRIITEKDDRRLARILLREGNRENKIRNRQITARDDRRLNDIINIDSGLAKIPLEEALDDEKSLEYHYKKHVMQPGSKSDQNKPSRHKYPYMSIQDYFNYATEVSKLIPTHIIDTALTDSEEISEELNNFISNGKVLKIDRNLRNNVTNEPMFVIINKNSIVSNCYDICLIDKDTNIPITVYTRKITTFLDYINKWLRV